MKKIISKILIIIGFVLILLSTIIFVKKQYESINAERESKKILENIEKLDIKEDNSDKDNDKLDPDKVVEIDGYGYIGTITIPEINLNLPIMSKFDYNRLKKAPCLYYGSFKTNDLVICAHDYKNHFGYLNRLIPGDLVIITDMNGNKHYYKVELIEELKDTDIEEMLDNDFDLTLFTCNTSGNGRVTVRCNLVNE